MPWTSASTLRSRARSRRRRGMSLVEVMVVIAILVALMALMGVGYAHIASLEQHRAAKRLALTFERLHDEAVLRNATFRIAYHLDDDKYVIEVGDNKTLIFSTPEERIEFEEERQRALRRYTEREIAEGDADDILEHNKFAELNHRFAGTVQLPRGTRFAGVYTPQYGEFVHPTHAPGEEVDEDDEIDPDDKVVAYSYIFSSGYAEHALVQIVSERHPDEGYTVEVEPMSGKVTLHSELITFEDAWDWVPEEAPELPN